MSSPPTGTVTFLFTDIEGSTKLWERDRAIMSEALARHDRILRDAVEQRGGYVFKTVGDAFCAAFATAPDALEAANSAQHALTADGPGATEPLRVRMALHTGAAEERGGDYFGPTLNRVARLLSAGHGAQTLLSLPAQELVRDQLPPGVGLRDLGEHRLKDLTRPERVFQLTAAGLPEDFPALRTLDARPNNLPMQPTALVGREKEVGAVRERLLNSSARLLTLTGPAGTVAEEAELVGDFRASREEAYKAIIAGAERVRRKAQMGGGDTLLEQLGKLEREFRAERRRDYFHSPLRGEAAGALKAAREAVREREAATRAPGAEGKP